MRRGNVNGETRLVVPEEWAVQVADDLRCPPGEPAGCGVGSRPNVVDGEEVVSLTKSLNQGSITICTMRTLILVFRFNELET